MEHISNLIPAVLENSVQVQPETKQPKTSDENSFEVAVLDKRISERPEEDLRQALRYAMMKVGLRSVNFPEGAEKMLLIAHIKLNYGNHTPAEIRLAFDMALGAKLGLSSDEIKCYESFSCLYFSTIMNAYRVWAAQVDRQKEKEVKPVEVTPTQDELDQIEKEYQEFLQTPLAKRLGKV